MPFMLTCSWTSVEAVGFPLMPCVSGSRFEIRSKSGKFTKSDEKAPISDNHMIMINNSNLSSYSRILKNHTSFQTQGQELDS